MKSKRRPLHWRSGVLRFAGNLVKGLSYPFHALFPKTRFEIPAVSPAKKGREASVDSPIPRIVWQTNFSALCTWPMFVNYLHNRRLSRAFEHRYVSTEARDEYVKGHASPRVYEAYRKLTDGAAQADLWRVVVLYNEGGIYMDIDAALVRPLERLLEGRSQMFVWDARHFSNFFLATVPRNPLYEKMLETIVHNIENYPKEGGPSVFYTTGPGAIQSLLVDAGVTFVPRQMACIQGVFTNERFQYMDRPRTKWKYKKTFTQE